LLITAYKKKLYQCRPHAEPQTQVRIRVSRKYQKVVSSDPKSIERGVRQLLADKVSGNLAGIWLLVAEHLRLGTWDLLCGWTGQRTERIEPRLALQLIHEAAVCTTGIRSERTLQNRGGFELANGLPFVATDTAIHDLIAQRTVADSQRLQVALGKIRLAMGHFQGDLLAIDPHRVRSYSKRKTAERVEEPGTKPIKMAQTFWILDADTHQPVCFTTATASQNVTLASLSLIGLAKEILDPLNKTSLIVADSEHFSGELIHEIHQNTAFDLLVPIRNQSAYRKQCNAIDENLFTRHWAGYATAKLPYEIKRGNGGTYWQFIQRNGECADEWSFKGFLSTSDRDEVQSLTQDFPKRWHVEEFFNANQALGWKRAGTMNLNIRYGQMSMALIAQATIHSLRNRLGKPYCNWDANHLAKDLFYGLECDVRVTKDTIVVTYYNAPNSERLQAYYMNLPEKLAQENIDPRVPWLYDYKLDFRFR
jgi:hypothetical protein